MLRPRQNRDKTSSLRSLRVKTRLAFVGFLVHLRQSLAFHLELHLRVALEHLRIPLSKQVAQVDRKS